MWFHLSSKSLGKNPTLLPRVPESASDIEDRTIPRICFAPSIEECLRAIAGSDVWSLVLKRREIFHVYGVHGKTKTIVPTDDQLPDRYRTNEVWRLSETTLKFLGKVEIKNGQILTFEPKLVRYIKPKL